MTPTAQEMLTHLATVSQGMTTRALIGYCPSAPDRTAVSRAAYDLRKEGLICEVGTVQSHTGRGARPVSIYAITQEGRAALGATETPASPPECPTCHGDDHTAPARNGVLDQLAALGMQPSAEPADDVLAELDDLFLRLVPPLPQASQHAHRLRALADFLARLVNYGDQTASTYLWLMELAELIDPDATRDAR